jgi:hypothetical protein
MSFRIRLYSLKITLPKTVFLNAQPLVIPLRVWKMAMSAVCSLLRVMLITSLTETILTRVRRCGGYY